MYPEFLSLLPDSHALYRVMQNMDLDQKPENWFTEESNDDEGKNLRTVYPISGYGYIFSAYTQIRSSA